MAEHELTITFTYHPGGDRQAPMLQAVLPNGAKFVIDPRQVHGKLGSNLTLFSQRAALEAKGEAVNICTAPKPSYDPDLITVVAPGTAYGVSPLKDREKKLAAKRKAQDFLDSLEITLEDI